MQHAIVAPHLWVVFGVFVVGMLALDLGVFSRKPHEVKFKEALAWTAVWVSLALIFNAWIYFEYGGHKALEFLTGYVIEEALSVDNIFVFIVLLASFGVPKMYQHRVLFWGVIGAILIFTGGKLLLQDDDHEPDPEKNPIYRLARRFIPAVPNYHRGKFMIVQHGKRYATPLLLVLIAIEATDVVFAVDSIPAVFAVTTDPFIVYTSNIFAILGLRSMYFLLAGVLDKFHYLKIGLALVLLFVGAKMVIVDFYKIGIGLSLSVIGGLLALSILGSILWPKRVSSPPP
jgi:tellurite resistance protein TerC